MANEAVLVQEKSLPISYKCSTSTGIEKGALLKNTSPMTAALSAADNDIIAGIAAQEVLSTNSGFVAVYRDGLFRVTLSGSVSAGDPVVSAAATGGANYVAKAAVNAENVLGIMLEDGTTGQTKLMELRPQTMQLA
jgi:hypothetical protein